MKFADQSDGEYVRHRRSEQDRRAQFALFDAPLLREQLHRVVVDGMRDLMAQRAGELLGVLDEEQQRVRDIHIAAWRRKRVRLLLVDEIELERVVVAWLLRARDGGSNRREGVVERRGRDDLALAFQLVEHFLSELLLLVLRGVDRS